MTFNALNLAFFAYSVPCPVTPPSALPNPVTSACTAPGHMVILLFAFSAVFLGRLRASWEGTPLTFVPPAPTPAQAQDEERTLAGRGAFHTDWHPKLT